MELIDKGMRDQPNVSAFPQEALDLLNLTLEAIDDAAAQCSGLPLSQTYITPMPETIEGTGYPNWINLPMNKN